jgi:hypothetical protein
MEEDTLEKEVRKEAGLDEPLRDLYRARWMDWVVLGVAAILTLAVVTLTAVSLSLLDRVERLEDQSYVTQAINCRNLVVDGVELSPDGPCLQPEVLRYYDPENTRATGIGARGLRDELVVNRSLLCQVLVNTGGDDTVCHQ